MIVPLREPDKLEVRVRFGEEVSPRQIEERLRDAVTVPTRYPPHVGLEEVDEKGIVLRINATPLRPQDGPARRSGPRRAASRRIACQGGRDARRADRRRLARRLGGARVRRRGRRLRHRRDRIRLAADGSGSGLAGWSLRGVGSTELDGLTTTRSDRPPPTAAPAHPNGITAIDHVVAITPDLERTVSALEAAGLDLRRIREEPTPAGAPRQAFFRLGGVILEVVQEPTEARAARHAFFWGLALVAPDLDAVVAGLGEGASDVRDAVQPGRRIATLRRAAGLAIPVALMTPPVAEPAGLE